MALRARLVAPPFPSKQEWPWHVLKAKSVPSSLLLGGDRRLEAETYLSSGFGIRRLIESKPKGWKQLSEVARIWMPGRLKGIQVSSGLGTPFLAATQVFDIRPFARKWLALARTADANSRFVKAGQILVTCSGSVGRATLAYKAHEDTLISHDLLRVDPASTDAAGWIYAYLRSSQVRQMAVGAHYGHIIKHLEPSHLGALPIPAVKPAVQKDMSERMRRIVELRTRSFYHAVEAEARFEKALGPMKALDAGERGFICKASQALFGGRRRLEAFAHNPVATAIRRHLAKFGKGFASIQDAGFEAWLPNRFRRIAADDGVLLVGSSDLTEVNPDLVKRIADRGFGDRYNGRVKEGWILMARSGQNYGIIGTAVIATKSLEDHIISDHVMRIRPTGKSDCAAEYLVVALTHPIYGRPLVKALACGSSIPEIDVADIAEFQVVRLGRAAEEEIAGLALKSARARAEADTIELQLGQEASRIIEDFMG